MNLSLLIHTFNGYRHVWPGCLKAWQNIDIPAPKYFGTDLPIQEKYPFDGFKVLHSGHGSWSDRLVTLLNWIPTDYVLYMQEDHWPKQNPPDLTELMQIVTKYDLFRLQISPITQYYTVFGDEKPFFFHPTSKYLVSHQPSIWLKSFFLEQIRYNEDPWLNEYEGTKRLNNVPGIETKIAIYPANWYAHKCVKGNLLAG